MAERQSCPECGRENDAGQLFCGSCGAHLVRTCPACGAASPLDFRFCGSCGTDLQAGRTPPRSGEERRVVTVLFADLVEFTSRSERLDPEDVRAILRPYYARLREEIESFGGTVEKFIGDAVMGLFGAPVAHGDDPERAVRAALRIREAITELNDADPELDLRVRIAVNTGEAIVSLAARPEAGESMAAGDVVNTAARLQSGAPVDGILVGEETYRCTRTAVQYEPAEPVQAKGKEAPVSAWRVLAAVRPPGERAAGAAPLVGRSDELAALTGVWERVQAERRAHLVTVFGPAGVGKTRLGAEFMAAARERGGQALRGRSFPYGASGPYGPFTQQVKQIGGIFDSDPPAVALEKLEAVVAGLVDSPDAGEVAAHVAMLMGIGTQGEAAERDVLFFSARRLVEALAARAPTVLVFEDAHWAAPSLLDLLELLASRVRDLPLLLVVLARPDLLDERPGWGGGLPASTVLELAPLSDEDAQELARSLLGEPGGEDGEAAAQVAAAAEGNPLFIEEFAASLAEHATAPDELPTSVRGIVAARLDALPAHERAVLLDASVVGKVFWTGALARIGEHGDRLLQALDSLENRDLIRREAVSRIQGEEQFRFKHMLIRDVAYATLPRARRREAHAAVAGFLEEATAESDAALGPHWREAGSPERALAHFLAAAEQASRGWAKVEAVRLFNEALALVPEEDAATRGKIRLRRTVDQQMLYHMLDVERLERGTAPPAVESEP